MFYCQFSLFSVLYSSHISHINVYRSGFDNNEDENSPFKPPFYEKVEDGIWNILMTSMPRGYMVPIPRVGRRHTHHEKRQNMIPQPRLGRQIDISEELVEILSEIQSLADKGNLNPRYLANKMKDNLSSEIIKDLTDNGISNRAGENTAGLLKAPLIRLFSAGGNHAISHFFQAEPTDKGREIDVSKIDILNIPHKEESVSSSEAMNSGPKVLKNPKCFACFAASVFGNDI